MNMTEDIISTFDKQVKKYGEKIAVYYKESSITYNELNYRSNIVHGFLK